MQVVSAREFRANQGKWQFQDCSYIGRRQFNHTHLQGIAASEIDERRETPP